MNGPHGGLADTGQEPHVRQAVRRPPTVRGREVGAFLTIGALGYVVDVALFNLLLAGLGATQDPKLAKVLSVGVAMLVTYAGNRAWTWRGTSGRPRARQVVLFTFFNLVGMGFSVAALAVSHDLLGLTSRRYVRDGRLPRALGPRPGGPSDRSSTGA